MLTPTTAKCVSHVSTATERMATVAYAMCQPIASGCATNTNLRTRGIMTSTSTSKLWYDGQPIEGWGTVGIYEGGIHVYGGFSTREEAQEWLDQLVSGAVIPIYTKAYNRG